MNSYIFKLLGTSRFLVIYENLYFIIFRWFLKLFSLYLLKPPMNDFKINIYKLVLVQKYGNKSQMSWEHNIRTIWVQASCVRLSLRTIPQKNRPVVPPESKLSLKLEQTNRKFRPNFVAWRAVLIREVI